MSDNEKRTQNNSILVLVAVPLLVTVIGGLLVEWLKPTVIKTGTNTPPGQIASISVPSNAALSSGSHSFLVYSVTAIGVLLIIVMFGGISSTLEGDKQPDGTYKRRDTWRGATALLLAIILAISYVIWMAWSA